MRSLQSAGEGCPGVALHAVDAGPLQISTPAAWQAPRPLVQGAPVLKPSSTVPLQSLSLPSQTSAPVGTQTQVCVPTSQVGVVPEQWASITHSTQTLGVGA